MSRWLILHVKPNCSADLLSQQQNYSKHEKVKAVNTLITGKKIGNRLPTQTQTNCHDHDHPSLNLYYIPSISNLLYSMNANWPFPVMGEYD